jgi:redox-sensing transcriptional repressor
VGRKVAGNIVRSVEDLADLVAETGCTVGIVATPAAAAQVAVDSLVASGVSSILNFAPTVVTVPDRVDLRQVDLATELQILGYHQHHRAVAGRAVAGRSDRATG